MDKHSYQGSLERINDYCWRIPRSYKTGMLVNGLIYASDALIDHIRNDQAPEQVANVAMLPGIQVASLAMPDIHWGYGFTIGGVCATDPDEDGVISPGGVGYDINCGVRLVRSELSSGDVQPHLWRLVDELFRAIPVGAGQSGKYRFSPAELRQLMREGVSWLKGRGLATDADIEHTEAHGCLEGAEPESVSDRALQRGTSQCGSLGSGNHFLEVQVVDEIFDQEAARVMCLEQDMVCVMIHSGSRGLGYQVCDDALRMLRGVPEKYGIRLPDWQLACAPVVSLRRRTLLGRDAGGRQLRMVQSATAHVAGTRGLC